MKKQIVQYVFNFAFLLFVFMITMVSVLQGENLKLTVQYILSADLAWVILAVDCVLIFIQALRMDCLRWGRLQFFLKQLRLRSRI